MSYSIERLLQKDEKVENRDISGHDAPFNTTRYLSDQESISDDDKSSGSSSSPPYSRKYDRRHKSHVPEDVRLRVNSRERERMHDLNSALDSLRQVMPYSQGPSVKKLSKMATLNFARNYIVMLNKSLDEMRRLVTDMSMKQTMTGNVHVPSATIQTGSLPYNINMAAHSNVAYLKETGSQFQHPMMPLNTNMHSRRLAADVPCPCNFCLTSLPALPKPDWKKSC